MIDKNTKIITDVQSVWGWHILSYIFFVQAINLLVQGKYSWAFGLIGIFVMCQLVALVKKWNLEKLN